MKAPYKVLFSNDTTGLSTCKSPYNPHPNWELDGKSGKWVYTEHFTEAMLEASVDETAGQGIDVHLLQPGMGTVPWWKSKVYPFAEHVKFMKRQTGMDPSANAFADYMAKGGDMVDVFVRRCRLKGLAPFISLRLNDSHGHEFVKMDRKDILSWAWHVFCPTHVQHPEWRISQNLNDWNGRVFNWAIPEVPKLKIDFIREICESYDIDGFELDFMRNNCFFDERKTPIEERRRIMNGFVSEVRGILDRTARNGRRRWLCVRVPGVLGAFDPIGVDLPSFVKLGVDMVNASCSYFTCQGGDLAEIRKLAPDASVYWEMCHCSAIEQTKSKMFYDCFFFRRSTPHQYWTTAHSAYAKGADGLSTFNFQYYREHGTGPRGPFHEPPFFMNKRLADKEWLARQPQHYFIGSTWQAWDKPERMMNCAEGPFRKIGPGETARFEFFLAPPEAGWRKGGRLRVQSPLSLDITRWKASLGGHELAETYDRSEPYANPYPNLLGANEAMRAWIVPPGILKEGPMLAEISLVDSGSDASGVQEEADDILLDKVEASSPLTSQSLKGRDLLDAGIDEAKLSWTPLQSSSFFDLRRIFKTALSTGNAALIRGEFSCAADGPVNFYAGADYFAKVWVDGRLLVDLSAANRSSAKALEVKSAHLTKGVHKVLMKLVSGTQGFNARLFMDALPKPRAAKTEISFIDLIVE